MSTNDDVSAIPGIQQNTAVTKLSLPAFASARNGREERNSRAESSTSGSRWSAADRQSRSPSDFRTKSVVEGSDDGKRDQSQQNTFQRRNKNRSSGGFLLEPATHSSRLSRALLARSTKDIKGKRKSESSEISLPKRRTPYPIVENDGSHRSSPLSTEVRQEADGQQQPNQNSMESVGTLQDRSASQDGYDKTPASQRSTTPSIGLETDPMQIVDMALKLSEGRRRQASGRRFVSGDVTAKRVISTPTSYLPSTPTRNSSRPLASVNNATVPTIYSPPPPKSTIPEVENPMLIDDSFAMSAAVKSQPDTDMIVEISRATASRVEKAKAYLELSYEHRRLLSRLPPVLPPGHRFRASEAEAGGKAYNPLQYVRNRKLRIREKSGIHAETEGWHDVEKVRVWVDAVVSSRTETSHDPLECVRLPPLSLQNNEEETENSPSLQASPRSPRQQQIKLRRPKSDWVTHPGDLIADAFWLEQGLNKTRIQDRDNNTIYPADTPFKFSGWRNRIPGQVPERLQQPTPPPEEISGESKVLPLAAAPELPTFRSAHGKEKGKSKNKKRSKLKDSTNKSRSDSRRRKMPFIDSSSESDFGSDVSSTDSDKRHRSRGRKRNLDTFDLPDGDPFGQPLSTVDHKPQVERALRSSAPDLSNNDAKRTSMDQSRLTNYLKRNSVLKSESHDRGRSRGDTKKHHLFHRREADRNARSSFEDDSTGPNSPEHFVLPSITINLDAPISRSPSPTKKSKSGILQSLKDRSKPTDHDKVDTTDFAKRHERGHSRDLSRDAGSTRNSSEQTSRGTSPFTKLRRESTPKDEDPLSTVSQKSTSISRQSTRPLSMPPQEPNSRIRGMFKGGRIAELVGNEVSRVGDFIWKRDIPPAYRHQMSGSEGSFQTYDASETEEDMPNGNVFMTPARRARPSISTQSSSTGRRSFESPRTDEKPQFHNPNLPSFTSPFQRDRDRHDIKQDLLSPDGPSASEDHISRQAAQHRNRSKSPRLDRIALPKLDTGAPRSVGLVERRNSYGFGDAMNRSQSASRLFNNAIQTQAGSNVPPRGSNAGLPNRLRQSADSAVGPGGSSNVNKHEISRIESLLLISAIKAHSLVTGYEQVPAEPSQFLLRMITSTDKAMDRTQLQVRKRDQYVFAARNLITGLVVESAEINDQLIRFSNDTVGQLHKQIQVLEDQIEDEITPRVRVAADNAGELSVKLTTTSTQAVKNLQDTISEAFRLRRRGPFRWLRLLWYAVIEYTVVGLLWFIWAIVTIIRIFLGLIKGTVRVTRWLLWID